jgi:hypothetical protein
MLRTFNSLASLTQQVRSPLLRFLPVPITAMTDSVRVTNRGSTELVMSDERRQESYARRDWSFSWTGDALIS